jgi:polyisoprenyl-teichoic acid--peptidoglycan teichoic acid transferase
VAEARTGHRLWPKLLSTVACFGFLLGSAWAALAVYTRVDGALFPGNELEVSLPGGVPVVPENIVQALPGVQEEQFQFSDPEDRINILVLGLDTRPEDATGASASLTDSKLTDTLFVVSIDPASKTASIVSFPRDLYVEIPFSETRILEDRINAVYECGLGPPTCREPYAEGGGPALAMRTIEYNFDIRIDHYMIIDWEGFTEVINTLGGVDIDVPEELGPPPRGNDVFDAFEDKIVLAGRQHMNGDQALGYSRFRGGPDGDFGRIERQQQMMFAVLDEAVSADLLNPAQLQNLWSQFRRTVETDIRDVQIPGLSLLASRIGPEDVTTYAVDQQDVRGTTTRQGASVLLPIHEKVNLVISEALADPQVRAERASILIQYAPADEELANELFAYLVEQGVPIGQVFLEESDSAPAITSITTFSENEYTIDRLLELLDLSSDRVAPSTAEPPDTDGGSADIAITIGDDFSLPS